MYTFEDFVKDSKCNDISYSATAKYIFEKIILEKNIIEKMIKYSIEGKPAILACLDEIELYAKGKADLDLGNDRVRQLIGKMVYKALVEYSYVPQRKIPIHEIIKNSKFKNASVFTFDSTKEELILLFERTNEKFINNNEILFDVQVSERTMCGALAIEISKEIDRIGYSGYYADVEYNRHIGNLQIYRKTIQGQKKEEANINTDIIVHGRGNKAERDNLIAIEMKKSTASKKSKKDDKDRLEFLTKRNIDFDYSAKNLGDRFVFGYELGIYYEVDLRHRRANVEFYKDGIRYAIQEYEL